ncbi:MAG: NAD(P)-dependent oxidoreductase [Candidatus Cloacimonadota bacterium]|nr:NAD(P)-dependent oxidoreductase [Candidatus Cloacimonadota bacterium]
MKVLLTGISGFIGKKVARNLIRQNHNITAIIRPQTDLKRINDFINEVKFIDIDLTDIETLKEFLEQTSFDAILHIGALRGGRKFSRKDFFEANVNASEQLMLNALQHNSKFIFCSSVGVYGTIPKQCPAKINTEFDDDNYYHYTKIQAEKLLDKYILRGLQAAIIRPSITYGTNDYGFPYTLTKLVDKKMMFLPNKNIKIHLANVNLVTETFVLLLNNSFKTGTTYNVADYLETNLWDLVDFISKELKSKPYPENRIIGEKWFRWGEKTSKFFKSDLWKARFQLISKSWYYDVNPLYKDLNLHHYKTIPNIKSVIDWYKEQNK